jgi:hypothetical protein
MVHKSPNRLTTVQKTTKSTEDNNKASNTEHKTEETSKILVDVVKINSAEYIYTVQLDGYLSLEER